LVGCPGGGEIIGKRDRDETIVIRFKQHLGTPGGHKPNFRIRNRTILVTYLKLLAIT